MFNYKFSKVRVLRNVKSGPQMQKESYPKFGQAEGNVKAILFE